MLPMCICCEMRTAATRYRVGEIGVCRACYERIEKSDPTMSFDSELGTAEYILSPFYYKDSFRDAILDYKFKGAAAYSDVFLAMLKDETEHIKYMLGEFDALIPVPLSRRRTNERGYNQAALIAEPLAEFYGVEYHDDWLIRAKNTRHQAGLKNYERMTNVRGAFGASEAAKGKSIIIFDDIFTTGSTIDECAKTLKAAGAGKIIGLTLSITERHLIRPEARIF